jgi:hypothetical protein
VTVSKLPVLTAVCKAHGSSHSIECEPPTGYGEL